MRNTAALRMLVYLRARRPHPSAPTYPPRTYGSHIHTPRAGMSQADLQRMQWHARLLIFACSNRLAGFSSFSSRVITADREREALLGDQSVRCRAALL